MSGSRRRQAIDIARTPCRRFHLQHAISCCCSTVTNGKASPYSITERRVPELIPVLGSQPAGDVSHKPGGMLPLLYARPAVTSATLKRTATNFAVNRGTVGVNSLPKTVTQQRRGCDLNPGPSAPESSTLTTRLPSHPNPNYGPNMCRFEGSTDMRQTNRQTDRTPRESQHCLLLNEAIVDDRLRPWCAVCCHCLRPGNQTAWRPLVTNY